MRTDNIFGIDIHTGSHEDFISAIGAYLKSSQFHYVVTPNPEMVMAAQKDGAFLQALQNADLKTPDGIGLIMASHVLHTPLSQNRLVRVLQLLLEAIMLPFTQSRSKISERISGVDIVSQLIEKYQDGSAKFYFLGGPEGVAHKAQQILEQKYPKIAIVGAEDGGSISVDGIGENDNQVIDRINKSGAQILLVSFGAPKQELWMSRNKELLASVRVALGVGGTLDFITGKQKRAPVLLRKMGLEWLWRLVQDPKRIRRIIIAFPLFPLYVAVRKFSMLQLN